MLHVHVQVQGIILFQCIRSNGLDYDALAFLVHTEVQGTLKKEIKELQQRIRLLEEE
jgi:hypothetical protein